jgi:hypothetical protein
VEGFSVSKSLSFIQADVNNNINIVKDPNIFLVILNVILMLKIST